MIARGLALLLLAACSREGATDESDTCDERAPCTYYVSARGDDGQPGTSEALAWRTLERVNHHAFGPGTSIMLAGGESFRGSLRFDEGDRGSAAAPLHLASFGRGRARIDAGAGTAITLENTAGIVIEDLILQGAWDPAAQSGNAGHGVLARNTLGGGRRLAHVRVSRLEVSGFRSSGMTFLAAPPDDSKRAGFEDVVLADSEVHDNGDCGVTTQGPFTQDAGYSHAAFELRGLEVYNQRGLRQHGRHTGSGIELADVDVARVERCVVHDNGEFNDHAQGGSYGIWAWDANAVVIARNESYANKSRTADGGGFDLDGGVTRSRLEYNYSHDNQGAGYGAFQFAGARPFAGNEARYNITQNDGVGMLLWDGNGDMGSFDAYQNVSYGHGAAVVSYSAVPGVRLFNNIFTSVGEHLLKLAAGAELTLHGNDYWSYAAPFKLSWNGDGAQAREVESLDAFRAATGHESIDMRATGQQVDPFLRAPGAGPTLGDPERLASLTMYQLAADSPLIDAGVDLRGFGLAPAELDFFGGSVPRGAFDVGVYEAQ